MGILPRKFHDKVYYFLLPALAFVLPVHERVAASVIALIGLNWLLELNFGEKFRRLKSSKISRLTLLFGIVYLPYLLGAFYSENFSGWSGAYLVLEVKLSLLIFPLVISTIRPEKIAPDFYLRVIKGFIWGCLFSAFLILNIAVYHYFQESNPAVFFYARLSAPFHPSYLALYYSFAIAILSRWLIRKYKVNTTKTVFVVIAILFFMMVTVMLSSKAGIIGVFIIFASFLFFSVLKIKEQGIPPIVWLLSLSALFSVVLYITSPALNRFYAIKESVEENKSDEALAEKQESTAIRLLAWKYSWEVIRENPLFGVGTGDVKQALTEKFREHNLQSVDEKRVNSHNQYLQTFMATGLPGFILLILGFLLPAWFAFKKRKILYFTFIVLMVFHNLVEGMLDRQAGVVFYALFNALMFYYALLIPDDQAFWS
ncbi:MAG: O-antigen ligase family protein [Bacteroidales bacterium]|nr:O-antigen ligase family protein [Bacteroidales bacterium]